MSFFNRDTIQLYRIDVGIIRYKMVYQLSAEVRNPKNSISINHHFKSWEPMTSRKQNLWSWTVAATHLIPYKSNVPKISRIQNIRDKLSCWDRPISEDGMGCLFFFRRWDKILSVNVLFKSLNQGGMQRFGGHLMDDMLSFLHLLSILYLLSSLDLQFTVAFLHYSLNLTPRTSSFKIQNQVRSKSILDQHNWQEAKTGTP